MTTWLTLSVREWQRRPLRTTLTILGVALATATVFSLLSFERGYRRGVEKELGQLGAHVLVVPKGCPYDAASLALHGATWPCYLKSKYLEEVRATPGVANAAPALMSAFYDEAGRQFVYLGVDTNMLALRPHWRIEGAFPARNGELLIGTEAARRAGWRLGQKIELPGLHGASASITGLLGPTHGAEDRFMFLALGEAQRLFQRPDELTHILVRLADPEQLEDSVRLLRGCDAGLYMNVVPLTHLFDTIQNVVRSTRLLLACLALVAVLVAGAGVSNTILMALSERTREIGVLRALGASRGQVFQLFWFQTIQVCLTGGVVGVGISFLGSRSLDAWVRSKLPFAPGEALVRWETVLAIGSIAGALLLGSLAGFLPANRAARLSPASAIRRRGGER